MCLTHNTIHNAYIIDTIPHGTVRYSIYAYIIL